jgi:hypothetical protein
VADGECEDAHPDAPRLGLATPCQRVRVVMMMVVVVVVVMVRMRMRMRRRMMTMIDQCW